MTDARSGRVPKPPRSRWTSFIGALAKGRAVRGLEEEGNPKHRARIEHKRQPLLVLISEEDGRGWTTWAIDRATREWPIAQRSSKQGAGEAAYELLSAKAGRPHKVVAADPPKRGARRTALRR